MTGIALTCILAVLPDWKLLASADLCNAHFVNIVQKILFCLVNRFFFLSFFFFGGGGGEVPMVTDQCRGKKTSSAYISPDGIVAVT